MTSLDYCIVGLYLAVTLIFGLLIGRRPQDLDDYLLAGRTLPAWLLLGSIVATETSTVTFLSVPGMSYKAGGDLRFLQLAAGFIAGRLLVAWLLLPLYFAGSLRSAYQALADRLGTPAKHLAAGVFLITRNLADGLRLFLTGLMWTVIVGGSMETALLVIAGVTVVYTWAGGLRSVVWNDCVQLVVYVGGAVLALGIILGALPGGLHGVLAFAAQQEKLRLWYGTWDLSQPYTAAAGLIGGAFLSLATHGADQMMVQRYLSARSARDAAAAVVASGLVVFVQFALFLFVGIGLAAYFNAFPPVWPIERPDAALATFIRVAVPAGIRGLLLAAALAAAMSTLSSSLAASATTAIVDVAAPLRWLPPDAPGNVSLLWSRGAVLIFAAVQLAVAWFARHITQHVIDAVLAIANFSSSVLLGVLLLAASGSRFHPGAAFSGMTLALAVMGLIAFFSPLAWTWYGLVGALLTVSFTLIAERVVRGLGRLRSD